MTQTSKPQLTPVPDQEAEETLSIAKPGTFDLDKFKSKRGAAMAGVETLQTALSVQRISEARDFVRLHPDEAYWSGELCFVNVPITGQKHELGAASPFKAAVVYCDM